MKITVTTLLHLVCTIATIGATGYIDGGPCKNIKTSKTRKTTNALRNGIQSPIPTKTYSAPQKSDRIAIIGGGVHGILTARALKKGGYTDVVVFEKERKLGKTTESFQADGRFFDYSTKFIPADSVDGQGIPVALKDLMDEYRISLNPYTVGYNLFVPSTGTELPFPEFLLPYVNSPEELVSNFTAGFELLKSAFAAGKTPEALIKAGIVLKTETWADFSERIQLPAFTDACTFYHDINLGGPANDHPAAIVLNVRVMFMPPYIKNHLLALGVGPSTTLPISDELRSVLANPFHGTGHVVNNGYQEVFDNIVKQEGIEVCHECEVTKLEKVCNGGGGHIKVYSSPGREQYFDHVIIASRPYDSLVFLKEDSFALSGLISKAVSSQFVTSYAFRADSTPQFLGNQFVGIAFPQASMMPRNGTIIAVAKDFPDSNVCVAMGYSNASLDASERRGTAKADFDLLEEYGIPVSESIGYRSYRYPSVPRSEAVSENWFGDMTELQGMHNMYVVGEALSGYGVPAALNFVSNFVETYFAGNQEI